MTWSGACPCGEELLPWGGLVVQVEDKSQRWTVYHVARGRGVLSPAAAAAAPSGAGAAALEKQNLGVARCQERLGAAQTTRSHEGCSQPGCRGAAGGPTLPCRPGSGVQLQRR